MLYVVRCSFNVTFIFSGSYRILQSLKSADMEDSDLTCFEHSMSLRYPSGSNQAVVSHDSELIPHDPIIPDDFLAPDVPDNVNNDN